MDLRALALLALALALISLSEEKPVSLTYRCPCRFYESNVARANIKHLKILSTPNCSLQIVARLKSNSKQVCIDPKLKWIQEYLEKALNKSFLSNVKVLVLTSSAKHHSNVSAKELEARPCYAGVAQTQKDKDSPYLIDFMVEDVLCQAPNQAYMLQGMQDSISSLGVGEVSHQMWDGFSSE
ncbi:hypothetical protein TURU_149036 [Turdus rufiventris]|nr:hypothetical protein TURU_149036 [Turdus rufiventris]